MNIHGLVWVYPNLTQINTQTSLLLLLMNHIGLEGIFVEAKQFLIFFFQMFSNENSDACGLIDTHVTVINPIPHTKGLQQTTLNKHQGKTMEHFFNLKGYY